MMNAEERIQIAKMDIEEIEEQIIEWRDAEKVLIDLANNYPFDHEDTTALGRSISCLVNQINDAGATIKKFQRNINEWKRGL